MRELDDGKSYRAKIVRRIKDKQDEDRADIKFIVELGEGEYDEILTYIELSRIVEDQQDRTTGDDNDTKHLFSHI